MSSTLRTCLVTGMTESASIKPVEPPPSLGFNHLVTHARGMATDPDGVTAETTVMGLPGATLRVTAERTATVTGGTNELVGIAPARLFLDGISACQWERGAIRDKWDGGAGAPIVLELERLPLAAPPVP